MKILNVDDNPTQRGMLVTLLERAGVEVSIAKSGSEAISKALTESPDAILLDINLPDINGFDVCSRIKADSRTAAVPVIFYTGERDGSAKNHAEQVGAAAFLTYPIEIGHLVMIINSVVAERGATQKTFTTYP
ncbi:MAG: two-component system response regulator [Acidobacteriales bacterium]|nr:two-component system response regulator [Terriglobales bacterium]